MRSPLSRLCLCAATVACLSATTLRAADTASLTTTKNVPYTGTVISDEYEKVVIEVTKTDRATGKKKKEKVSVPAGEVRKIKYSPTSLPYINGESFFRQGRYKEALAKFDEALKAEAKTKWVGQYARFYRGQCLGKMAEADKKQAAAALKAYGDLIAKHPKSRFLPDAYLGMASVYHVAGNHGKMGETLKKLDPAKFGSRWAIKRKLWDATLLEAKKQYDLAQKAYAVLAVEAEKAKDRSLKEEALLSQGRCLLLAKKIAPGEDLLFKLGKDSPDENTKAKAFNTLGDGFWARKEYNEALFAYLRVAVLYLDEPEERPKALYWAGKCFEKRGDKTRAKEQRDELKREYKDSPWAKKK